MLAALIGKNVIYKMVLPQKVDGSYWISDSNTKRNFIEIEALNGYWTITTKDNINIFNAKNTNDNTSNKFILSEYESYVIQYKDTSEVFILYCMPVCENQLFHLKIQNKTNITIGSSKDCDITFYNNLVAPQHAQLSLVEGKWEIQNLDNRYATFVNNKSIDEEKVTLNNGDVIFIMGCKIIIMGDTIFINNPQNKLICKNDCFTVCKTEAYATPEEKMPNSENFFRVPRVINRIEEETIKIDAPPEKRNDEEDPLILSIGPSAVMGLTMILSVGSAISGQINGTSNGFQTAMSITMALSMIIGMIVFPIARRKYKEAKDYRYEEKRHRRYNHYLKIKRENITELTEKKKKMLFENYIAAKECEDIVLNQSQRLLERKIKDYDFLKIRLGIGDIPSYIKIQCPEENFTLEEDELYDPIKELIEDFAIMPQVPILASLVDENIISILGKDKKELKKYLQNLLAQIITLNDFENLKLVFLLKEEILENNDCIKMLPHVWSTNQEVRFFATDDNDIKEIARYLEEEFNIRKEKQSAETIYHLPHYLIITDCYNKLENLRIMKKVLQEERLGFSILNISNDLEYIPNECKKIINITSDNEATIFLYDDDAIQEQKITIDDCNDLQLEKICKTISNIKTNSLELKDKKILPNNLTFLDMFDVGLIEQLNILKRWQTNDSTLSLKALLGIDEAGLPIILDIHEKAHGPHGLIAGSTGSGKSELIITYVLSMAINYHPDDVNFVLIDYKGGGLAGAFQKKNIKLPHLVGTITNIDINGLTRSLASIKSEIKRRQIIFNEVRDMTDEGTIDIYKYQTLYHSGKIREPLPHLLIICDEFAELKQQQPDFMSELISVSRIGRSLGVHLILATQKPAGIVDEQIRSNSKFAICLKVQDKADSNDVIKRDDAINLKKAGQFYMLVGNDEYFILGQSGWAGAPYIPIEKTQDKKEDSSVTFIDSIGQVIKKVDNNVAKVVKSRGEQLTNIVEYLSKLAEQQNIKRDTIWLDELNKDIYVEELRKKYRVLNIKNEIVPVIGEYDNPEEQQQGVVTIDLTHKGNTIVYGNAESGKETLLSTMVYDLISTHTTDEVNLYLFDFGTESLKAFKDCAHVGDIAFINDEEKISRYFEMMLEEINNRKAILSDYGGDYKLYLKKSGKPMPMIVTVINNYEAFIEMYQNNYDDVLLALTREGTKYGINFVLTLATNTSIRYRLANNFKNKIVLQLNKEQDYYEIFEKLNKKKLANIFGRGLITLKNDNICEFQTAKITETEGFYEKINNKIIEVNQNNQKVKRIPVLPEVVSLKEMVQYINGLESLPIGINPDGLRNVNYDFKKEFVNCISSKDEKDAIEFAEHIIQEMKYVENTEIKVINVYSATQDELSVLAKAFDKYIKELDKNQDKNIIITFLGINKFVTEYEKLFEKEERYFIDALEDIEEYENVNLIIAEGTNQLKEHEFSEWYKPYMSKKSGIWVGDGIENQYTFNVDFGFASRPKKYGREFGYIVKDEAVTLIKLLEMRENSDE